jgi:L-threonylcarbamoyladenylate synthase
LSEYHFSNNEFILPDSSENFHLQQAIISLKAGGVIAYPTEGVWGLGCVWTDETAIKEILRLKQRPLEKGMIILCSQFADIEPFLLPLSPEHIQQIEQDYPHPVTWILPCKLTVAISVRGQHSSLAVRFSHHPQVQSLCEKVGPIISTSANPTGLSAAMTDLEVRHYFHDQLSYILPGELGGYSKPSEIRTLDGRKVR